MLYWLFIEKQIGFFKDMRIHTNSPMFIIQHLGGQSTRVFLRLYLQQFIACFRNAPIHT